MVLSQIDQTAIATWVTNLGLIATAIITSWLSVKVSKMLSKRAENKSEQSNNVLEAKEQGRMEQRLQSLETKVTTLETNDRTNVGVQAGLAAMQGALLKLESSFDRAVTKIEGQISGFMGEFQSQTVERLTRLETKQKDDHRRIAILEGDLREAEGEGEE
jgi:predicted RNase H-like nuclease (RuvC/YqgF family)